MEDSPVYHEQELLTRLVRDDGLISGAAVAHAAGCSTAHLYGLMQGRRRVPVYVWNTILRLADTFSQREPDRYWKLAAPILSQLLDGTSLFFGLDTEVDASAPVDKLCAEAACLLKNMGGLMDSLSRILADGQVDHRDDPTLEEFHVQQAELTRRLHGLDKRLKHERAKAGRGAA
ncbi:MAG: hypothetical protein KAV82_11760 [Phycisphaerae bacterium]|nr:hypothetical protein [Phycisphaerae bacterium]